MKLSDLIKESNEEIDCSVLKRGMMVQYYDKNDRIAYGSFEYKDNEGNLWIMKDDGEEDEVQCKDIIEIFNND